MFLPPPPSQVKRQQGYLMYLGEGHPGYLLHIGQGHQGYLTHIGEGEGSPGVPDARQRG